MPPPPHDDRFRDDRSRYSEPPLFEDASAFDARTRAALTTANLGRSPAPSSQASAAVRPAPPQPPAAARAKPPAKPPAGRAFWARGDEPSGRIEGSVLSADLVMTGSIATDGALLILGRVDGPIFAAEVTLGPTARIQGEIIAERATLEGPATGRITAREVRLRPGARFVGDIACQMIVVEDGADFEGVVRRTLGRAEWADIVESLRNSEIHRNDKAARTLALLEAELAGDGAGR